MDTVLIKVLFLNNLENYLDVVSFKFNRKFNILGFFFLNFVSKIC